MTITDLNRLGGIGSNCLLIEWDKFRFVVDCGLHPKVVGSEALPEFSLLRNLQIDFLVLTHCHLDHLGALPVFCRNNPFTEIILSHPSATLAGRMMRNSVNVMKRQREELGLNDLPLYTHGDIDLTESLFHPIAYERPRLIEKDGSAMEVSFYRSGHIPGAASVLMKQGHRSLLITGDVLFEDQEILPGARLPDGEVDVLVTETTHGAKPTDPDITREGEVERLLKTIDETLEAGGNVLLPVFALGRMQEICAILNRHRKAGNLERIPIFAAGLGMDIANYFDELSRRGGHVNFRLRTLNELKVRPLPRDLAPGALPNGPGIYIVSSGMMVENTPSYRVAASLLSDPDATICFVGYCDPDTPGAKLQQVAQEENFLFETLDYITPKRAKVERFDLSGHASRDQLLNMILRYNPRSVVLTHGDEAARAWFEQELYSSVLDCKVIDPQPLQPIQL
ncbi:MAG: MBL fold metallo-hydrolase [Puniceicoccaceae bacterium]